MAAAKLLETGETFNNPSRSDTVAASESPDRHEDADDNSPDSIGERFWGG